MEPNKNGKKNKWLSWLGALGVLIISLGGKLKALIPLLKLGKIAPTIITMLLSMWAYTIMFPFQVAVGFVLMIFIHEMGHVLAARQKGLPTSVPAFIPFVGALIMLKKQPQDAATEAYVAYGGPLLGTIGSIGCYGLGVWTGDVYYFVIAYLGFIINLFNLIPIHPLDGGRIVVAISRWFWVLGLILGLVVIVYTMSIILMIIYVMFAYELYSRYIRKKKKTRTSQSIRPVFLEVEVDPWIFQEAGAFIPGENHERDLEFVYYSDIHNRQTYLDFYYPGVGRLGTHIGFIGEVVRVRLNRSQSMDNGKMKMLIVVECRPDSFEVENNPKDEKYYQVTPKQRIQYGVAYIGLAVLLVGMIYITLPFISKMPM